MTRRILKSWRIEWPIAECAMEGGALSDLRVVELGHSVSAPYCAKLLADLGAEVIKVEEVGVGDVARRRGPFPNDEPHPERSGLFLYLNTNKLGVTLDVRTSTGRRIFQQLVKEADTLVEDNPPSMMKELGLDYESLRQANPRLVMTSITSFGQTGPYRDYKATDLISFHMGGLAYATPGIVSNPDDEPPLRGGGQLADFLSGLTGAVATLCAVFDRMATGLGQQVDISKHEAIAAFMRSSVAAYAYENRIPDRLASPQRPGGFGLQRCKDGYVTLATGEDHHWRALVQLMGNPKWAEDERFKDRASRTQNAQALLPLIEEWTKQHTKDEIISPSQAKGVPSFPINTIADAVNSPQLTARRFFVDIDHPKAGRARYPGPPHEFSSIRWGIERPAPLLGQHNEEIYCGLLGYTKQELVKLAETGVI